MNLISRFYFLGLILLSSFSFLSEESRKSIQNFIPRSFQNSGIFLNTDIKKRDVQNTGTPKSRIKRNVDQKISKNLAPGKCTKELVIDSVISSGTLENVEYALRVAEKDECSSLLLLINTPGGSVVSARKIVEAILQSEIPVLCLVHPFGAHAGSAGAIILQSCHVNGALETTNLGAATPILGTGKNLPEDLKNKMVNDLTSWLDSLTELRGRNKKFGQEIIKSAKAVSAREAHEIGAIDIFCKTKEDFLKLAHGQLTRIQNQDNTIPVLVGEIQPISRGIRYYFVNFITDPELVYLLFIGSLLLIYFELTHAGFILPGILGVMGLILAFIGMHKLSVVWGGALLILLGLILMTLEAFITSFGILAISGVVSFVLGSIFLFDPSKTGGLSIPMPTILITTIIFATLALGIAYLALGTLKRSRKKEEEEWIGKEGEVVKVQSASKGLFEIQGETWRYKSKDELKEGDMVQIVHYSGMVFTVKKLNSNQLV